MILSNSKRWVRSVCHVLLATAIGSVCHGANEQVYEPNDDPLVGFNLISWFNFGNLGATRWRDAVQDLHDSGFREVSISPVRFIDLGTGEIPDFTFKGPNLSHVAAGIVRAKELGMRVTVNPFVEPGNFDFWRGFYDPTPGSSEWITFWNDYEGYLVEVAEMAQANGADAMTVGTELRAITRNSGNNPKWDSVIAAVDAEFTGELGYAANWDNYQNGNLTSTIWENPAIDFLGIDAYFTNTTTNAQSDASGADPNETFISQVEQGWNNRLDNQILPFAANRQSGDGLPVVLTEVGYLPYNRTTVNPQNSGVTVDTDEQVMAFKGLTRALDGRADELSAMHIWQWGMPGSNGSLWNINSAAPLDQPNNLPLGEWLSTFVSQAALAGDFNSDGTVDSADYTVWRDALGQAGAGLSADANADGVVNQTDYQVWAANFTGIDLAPSAAVPEPVSALLLVAAVLLSVSERAGK